MSEIVFLAGTDPEGADPASGGDAFYANAKQFFTDQDASIPVIEPASGSTEIGRAHV